MSNIKQNNDKDKNNMKHKDTYKYSKNTKYPKYIHDTKIKKYTKNKENNYSFLNKTTTNNIHNDNIMNNSLNSSNKEVTDRNTGWMKKEQNEENENNKEEYTTQDKKETSYQTLFHNNDFVFEKDTSQQYAEKIDTKHQLQHPLQKYPFTNTNILDDLHLFLHTNLSQKDQEQPNIINNIFKDDQKYIEDKLNQHTEHPKENNIDYKIIDKYNHYLDRSYISNSVFPIVTNTTTTNTTNYPITINSHTTNDNANTTIPYQPQPYDKSFLENKLIEFLQILKLQDIHNTSTLIDECKNICDRNSYILQKKREKKNKLMKEKNKRIFKKILKERNTTNDYEYYSNLDVDNQKKLIQQIRLINNNIHIEKPYRIKLLETNIPINFKSIAFKKINLLKYMESGTGEYYKIKNWVDTFMKIPFYKYNSLSVSIEDGIDKCNEFMQKSYNILQKAVFGLDDAKIQIMQFLGLLITNQNANGTAISIQGPPGTGKTSLIKEGVSKILERPFAFIALGGATDSSFLEGHSYTYEGSTWGKILQILIDSKCMNPVIYFDELDKVSDTPKGEEIIGILTHLTDITQNNQFHDKYFNEIDFDLSKCLFIFSYNDESKINPILKDRMYRIKTNGYNNKQKSVIAQNYIIPKIQEQVKFNQEDILIDEKVIQYINEKYCMKEEGVRNLKRCLETIYTKLNLYRLMKPNDINNLSIFQELNTHIQFPFQVSNLIVDKLLKHEDFNKNIHNMYI